MDFFSFDLVLERLGPFTLFVVIFILMVVVALLWDYISTVRDRNYHLRHDDPIARRNDPLYGTDLRNHPWSANVRLDRRRPMGIQRWLMFRNPVEPIDQSPDDDE